MGLLVFDLNTDYANVCWARSVSPAVAGGTDPVQQEFPIFEAKPFANALWLLHSPSQPGTSNLRSMYLSSASSMLNSRDVAWLGRLGPG